MEETVATAASRKVVPERYTTSFSLDPFRLNEVSLLLRADDDFEDLVIERVRAVLANGRPEYPTALM